MGNYSVGPGPKAGKVRQPLFICVVVLGIVAARASAQNQQPNTDNSAESIAFQAAHNQTWAQLKVKLLEEFATKYPDSNFLPQVYRDAYMTYFSPLGDYPRQSSTRINSSGRTLI